MYSYRQKYLLQLDNSIRLRSNNTFCTLFRKDFHFWFRYEDRLFFLNSLDICKNRLLIIVKLQQLIQFSSHTCLTSVWEGYDKMRHVNYNLYQNTNTVIHIETNFYRHNQEHFLFLLQKPDFTAVWEVPWVWQTRALMEEENSPCLALHPTQWGFNWSTHRKIVKGCWRKWVVYAWSEHCSMSNCDSSQLNSMSSRWEN